MVLTLTLILSGCGTTDELPELELATYSLDYPDQIKVGEPVTFNVTLSDLSNYEGIDVEVDFIKTFTDQDDRINLESEQEETVFTTEEHTFTEAGTYDIVIHMYLPWFHQQENGGQVIVAE